MATMNELSDSTIPVVKNLLLLDSEGKRIAVKYYSPEWCARRAGGGHHPQRRWPASIHNVCVCAYLNPEHAGPA